MKKIRKWFLLNKPMDMLLISNKTHQSFSQYFKLFSWLRQSTLLLVFFGTSYSYSQKYSVFIRNYENQLYYVYIDSVLQNIRPSWGHQIMMIPTSAKVLMIINEKNKPASIDLDKSPQSKKYYEVFMKDSFINIKKSTKTWTVLNVSQEPVTYFKSTTANQKIVEPRRVCEFQNYSLDLIFLKSSQIQSNEKRLGFLIDKIGKHCLRVDNVKYFSQLFSSDANKLNWFQSIYLQTLDKQNFRTLSQQFTSLEYNEKFQIWLNQITKE